jgi:hypothetical protein
MKTPLFLTFMLIACGRLLAAASATLSQPLPGAADLVFEERDGIVAIEAEHFGRQTHTTARAFYLTTADHQAGLTPDPDPAHVAGASGGAYLEILPDTRTNHDDKLINGENFAPQAGSMATLHYRVHFNTPGRYYVWCRVYSTNTEDNGVHVGLNGAWPESGRRWQTTQKNAWIWDCRQRTNEVHVGVPLQLFLDIPSAGVHEIAIAMREDGFELDKLILVQSRDFKPEGVGPAPRVKQGTLPAAFAAVSASGAAKSVSGAAAVRAVSNTGDAMASAPRGRKAFTGIALNSQDFPVEGTGYYRDRDRWLAIHPERNKEARTRMRFGHPPGRYDITLHCVGESDGKAVFELAVDDKKVGSFACPLSSQTFEEGERFTVTWRNVDIETRDFVEVHSRIASEDGREFSRARWIGLTFAPSQAVGSAAGSGVAAAVAAPLVLPRQRDGGGTVTISGELNQWHKVTLDLAGPYAHERDTQPNAFTDHRFTVAFEHESGTPRYQVPGYFAADGNAGQSGAEAGTVWRAHLSPDKPGKWNYRVTFVRGARAAVEGGGTALAPFDGKSGSFAVAASDKTGRDFRGKGRLTYVGGHHLRFAGNGEYFLKAGPDSPETFLGTADFDGTIAVKANVPLKTWAAHARDWRAGDPEWRDGKGRNLIGALNYLAAEGLNSFSFLTYNAAGDGDNVWPFIERNAKLHYDCSKLDQWGIVFDHAAKLGLYLHFKLQETENDDQRRHADRVAMNIPEALDGGATGIERKLYLRELIARFGHALALNWNLGEENTQTSEEQRAMAQFIADADPYDHPIVIHSYPTEQDRVYPPLLGSASVLHGASLQNDWNVVHARTLKWLNESAKAGRPWVVANDEQGPASLGVPPDAGFAGFDGTAVDGNHRYTAHDTRKLTLWGNLMAGGAGVEYYFGYRLAQNDLLCEDFRSRDKSWDWCRIALELFRNEKIPFWEMKNANALVGNDKNDNTRFCLAKPGEVYLVYLPNGGGADLDLATPTGAGKFSVSWFNPREGGALKPAGDANAGGKVELTAPSADDWLAVVRRK